MQYILQRTTFGWCWWDLVAFVILVGVSIYCYKRIQKMKDQKEDLENRLTVVESEKIEDTAEI